VQCPRGIKWWPHHSYEAAIRYHVKGWNSVPNNSETMHPTRKTHHENYFQLTAVISVELVTEKATFWNQRINMAVINYFPYFSNYCWSSFLRVTRCTRLEDFKSFSKRSIRHKKLQLKTISGLPPPSWKHTILNWDNLRQLQFMEKSRSPN